MPLVKPFDRGGEARPLVRIALVLLALAAIFAGAMCRAAEAQITWNGPRLSPQEAADVLARAPGLANLTGVGNRVPPDGPRVFVMGGRPGAATWLDFPAPTPRLRLDGTPAWLPPTTYGSPFWYQMPYFDTFHRSEGVAKGGRLRQEPHHRDPARDRQ